MKQGYKALHEGAAVFDVSDRGRIKVLGGDRVRLVHAMSTNNIEALAPGQETYAFFLTAQGRILADAIIYAQPDHLLLDTEPEARSTVFEHIDRYIIADDVTLEDATAELASVAVEGPRAGIVVASLEAAVPEEGHIAAWGSMHVARVSVTGAEALRFYLPAAEKPELMGRLEASGAVSADADDVRTVRIENARPRFGDDLTGDYIPHETQLLRAVSFNKGCYLGQEIVERVRSRGQVNKKLVPLRVSSQTPPAAGAKLAAEGKDAGVITSAALSPALGAVVALGYVRTAFAKEGQKLEVDGAEAEVSGLAPR